jgi:hypothetical protein
MRAAQMEHLRSVTCGSKKRETITNEDITNQPTNQPTNPMELSPSWEAEKKTSQHFKEPEGSQETSIDPYPEPDQSSPYLS